MLAVHLSEPSVCGSVPQVICMILCIIVLHLLNCMYVTKPDDIVYYVNPVSVV